MYLRPHDILVIAITFPFLQGHIRKYVLSSFLYPGIWKGEGWESRQIHRF